MDSLKQMNAALDYIEDNLTGEIDLDHAARLAVCSRYHFQRMFSSLSGLSLSEYIRRRRLTLAALALRQPGARVLDVALNHGYTSADSFTRAFQAWHGITPSQARAAGQPLQAFSRLSFQLSIRGGSQMKYRIVEKEPFQVVGFMQRVPIVFHGVNPHIAAMWQRLDADTITRLKSLSNVEPRGMISASTNFSEGRMEEQGGLDHYIGVATTLEAPADFASLPVPALTWAVFEAAGKFPDALQEVWGRIYAEWFPSSGYEAAEGPEMLWNESKDTSLPNYRSEIWVPVTRPKPEV